MENETSKTRSLKVAFLLDPTNLKNLQTLLSEVHGPTEYRVKFSDGSTVKYDVEEIIGQPNAGEKFIVAVMASVEGEGRSIFLGMRGDPEPSVEYTLAGRQRDVFISLTSWTTGSHLALSGIRRSTLQISACSSLLVSLRCLYSSQAVWRRSSPRRW